MSHLNSVLSWRKGAATPEFQIEDPNELQSQILAALGYRIEDGSVLQLQA